MTLSSPIMFGLILVFLMFILVASIRSRRRKLTLASLSEKELIQKLHPVPFEAIETLALQHLQSKDHTTYDPMVIWSMLGHASGVRHMTENADVMIAMASYVERWNPDALEFETAKLRRDGVLLKRAASRLGRGVLSANAINVSLYAHEAATMYYLMTQRLRSMVANPLNSNTQFAGAV